MTRSSACVSKSLRGYSTTPYIPILPFLFQTRTILRLSNRPSESRAHASTSARTDRDRRQTPRSYASDLTRLTEPGASTASRAPWKTSPKDHDSADTRSQSIRFRRNIGAHNSKLENVKDTLPEEYTEEDPGPNVFSELLQESKPEDIPRPVEKVVTMTREEQEIFDRLQRIADKRKARIAQAAPRDEFDAFLQPNQTLEALFDKEYEQNIEASGSRRILTTKGAMRKQKRRQKSPILSLPPMALASVAPVVPTQYKSLEPGMRSSPDEMLEEERFIQLIGLQRSFLEVKSDLELWTLLERHAFKDMELLQKLMDKKDGKLPANKNRDKNRKAKKPDRKPKDDDEETPPEPKSINSESGQALLSQVINTYGAACLHAMRLFRVSFPKSLHPMRVLHEIKRLGPISFVLAANTSLYNELLYIYWLRHRDLNACAGLLEEMADQNILADRFTAAVYQDVSRSRAHDLRSKEMSATKAQKVDEKQSKSKEPTSKPNSESDSRKPMKTFNEGWWKLQGTEAAWTRLNKAYDRLVAMTRAEIQRKKEESSLYPSRAPGTWRTAAGQENEPEYDSEPDIEILSDDGEEPEVQFATA